MAASTTTFGTLSVALAQAITWLTRHLITVYPATTIIKLQLALDQNLTAQFQSSWAPHDPVKGSGRRCLTLSPACAPPRSIYNACKSAGIDWSKWIATLGGLEFDLFIDPGNVSIHYAHCEHGKVFTIWREKVVEVKRKGVSEEALQVQLKAQAQARALAVAGKTLAQQIICEADDDDELFAMIADEVREPTWITPTSSEFPAIPPPRSTSSSPVSIMSASSSHSRSSSCSSSSAFSFSSYGSTDSYGSTTTVSHCSTSPDSKSGLKLSRRERARQSRVYIDKTRTEVTNYDGGKTTVLTGGVMLGAASKPNAKLSGLAASAAQRKANGSTAETWRSIRA
ncbi:uncharacterized protein PHACADRAFT_247058 [Phanerochaete carnosa HHB-10118-sp]|uniref:Anti-proliferative protein domain-containing protein n=1 Tax=Phanerochaete carnosa (strain HHB-10118-sp) TaxID=650164 RepID=K5WN60_PHACS|nr:uncharacterized protein PHACADRAFT_247058 [Phanerochaete carnosa HHB-10118-sp]EKM60860.1 hypothetical protein PHACADRAFT_247058 [Phanerochaete carnosa HHB-10118-sp]